MRTSKKTRGILELPAEAVGEEAVRADDEAHEVEARVVYLAEDAAGTGAGHLDLVELLVYTALRHRRRHIHQSLPKTPPCAGHGMRRLPRRLLIDKYLYNQILYRQ
jgi:hypothetical protein